MEHVEIHYPHLPGELVAECGKWLDLSDVGNLLVSCAGDKTLRKSIRTEYLSQNYHFLLTTQQMKSWQKRKENTLEWMQYNDWIQIFHGKTSDTDPSAMQDVEHYLHTLDHCRPFFELTASVERGILEITKFLIEKGHDINQEREIDNGHYTFFERPLNCALTLPSDEMLRYMLSKETEVNYRFQLTFSNSILHFAASDDRVSPKNLNLLLSHPDIDVNVRDSIGKTPLHYACWFLLDGYDEKIELLLKAGANVNAHGNDFMDPLQVLEKAGRHRRKYIDDTADVLKMHGAIEIRIGP